MTSSLLVRPQRKPLHGSVPVPSDRSITHRALILAALSNGPCELRGFGYGSDNLHMLGALGALGVRSEDDGRGTIKLRGVGLAGLTAPSAALDCGRSPTCLRLLTGVLAGQHFASRLGGHPALERQRLRGVLEPLRARGARLTGVADPERPGEETAPVDVAALEPNVRLGPLTHALSRPSDHAKGALLLSGLFASGPTIVQEPVISRDHTERLLAALDMPIHAAGPLLSLHPPADPLAIKGFDFDVPGDLSAAAFLLVAAQIVPDSHVTTRRTGLNPTRSGILEIIRLAGGRMGITPGGNSLGEPYGEVTSRGSVLRGIALGDELAERGIDEIAAACVLAARARGVTHVSDIAELRDEHPDRVAAMAGVLRAFGVGASERPDGLVIEGRPETALTAARVASGGDHRICMAAALLGLVADGESVIEDADCLAVSFPRFVGTLRSLGADIEVRR
ncbi:MAG TPA: 3-phosphoshikimate 1-carboxyvinyltransferase [Polyangiaceae bacterium]|jgi:3-phosphoshikimate 1-carboxyvinyltransferase|nr:3-phosphoshikimate 1-carboxyvinyltransferase [Polyangiaceae bacterium]